MRRNYSRADCLCPARRSPAAIPARKFGVGSAIRNAADAEIGSGTDRLDAYVYGYSLITTEVTRVQMSNVDKIEGMHAPTGSSPTSSATHRPTSVGFRRQMPTRFIRWLGSI